MTRILRTYNNRPSPPSHLAGIWTQGCPEARTGMAFATSMDKAWEGSGQREEASLGSLEALRPQVEWRPCYPDHSFSYWWLVLLLHALQVQSMRGGGGLG